METSTINISKKIQKYEEKSVVIFHDINDLLDSSNKVKKNVDTLIKLGESINDAAFKQITHLHSCSSENEKNFKHIAGLMLVLVDKSKDFHQVFANHDFYKTSLKSSLEKFELVISEMQEAAEDILSNLDLKHDKEWSEITADIETNLSKLN
jgi:hypothetical protein